MKTSQESSKTLCLVAALERSVAVKGQVHTNSERGGQKCQIGWGGGGDEGKDNKMTIPDPLLGLSVATGTIKSKLDAQ